MQIKRQPGRFWAAVVAFSLAIPVLLTASAPAWSEIRGEHFILRTRHGFRDGDRVACDIERVVAAWSKVLEGFPSSSIPAIMAVENERDARELLPQFWERRGARPVGAFWTGTHGHHIVVRVNATPQEQLRRILHEYTHFAAHLALVKPPRWLDEGLAELWTNAAIERGRVELGGAVARHQETLRSAEDWIPIAQLTSEPELRSPRDTSRLRMFYAESWALAHYLVIEKRVRLVDLGAEATYADLPSDKELQRYVNGAPLNTIVLSTALETCVARKPRQLSETESSILKAQMLADGERPEAALPLLRDVLRREPGNVEAAETLAFVHFVGNRPREAAGILDRVIGGGSATFRAYYYRALLTTIPDRNDGSGPVPVAEYLARAIELNPAFTPARERLREIESNR